MEPFSAKIVPTSDTFGLGQPILGNETHEKGDMDQEEAYLVEKCPEKAYLV